MITVPLVLAILSIVGIGIPVAFSFAFAKIKLIKNETLREATYELTNVLQTTVNSANATVVKAVRNDNDGKISKEDAMKIKAEVQRDAINSLTETSKKVLERELGKAGIDIKISNMIEDMVHPKD